MSKKTPPRWIYATAVLAGAVFVATVVALVATFAASSYGGQYARESSGKGQENHGGGIDSSPSSSSSTTNTIRMPTTVRPSPAPSVSMLDGDILDVSTTVPRTVPTTTAATPLPPPSTTPTTAGSLPVATVGPPTTTTLFPAPTTPRPTIVTATPAVTTNTTTTAAPVLGPAGVSNPVDAPTTTANHNNNNNPATTTTWYGIGDIPYAPEQAEILTQQMRTLPSDAEFLIHVGDLRLSGINLPCRMSEYQDVANRLALSHAPVFVILGDNDWTDCPDRAQGLRLWKQTFVGFESKHWNHTFVIERQTNRTENFAFVHKGTLFMGLNLVGGLRHSKSEWEDRLTEQADWTIDLIQRYKSTTVRAGAGVNGPVGRIVIFGHANPNYLHKTYFHTLQNFIAQQLNNEIPILYLNGDKHEWSYDADFMGQPSFLRVMVSGKGIEPPIKVVIDSSTVHTDPVAAFVVDRRL